MDQRAELSKLMNLARDKSQGGRSMLVTAIKDLYGDQGQILTQQDRAIMVDIMQHLITSVAVSVRQSLAEQFADQADAPKELIVALANDEIKVAHDILAKSDVLKDAELLDIIRYRAMEHQVIIAMRQTVSPRVSDALVKTENEKVVTTLLSNDGAEISDQTMGHLVDAAPRFKSYQGPLAHRSDLSPELVRKLYKTVTSVLRDHIVESYDLDPVGIDETIEAVIDDALDRQIEIVNNSESSPGLIENSSNGDEHALIKLLRQGEVAMFLDQFTALSRLPLKLVRKILFEPGGEALAVICRAIGLDKHTFISVLIRFRHGRLGEKHVEEDELTNAVRFYDQTTVAGAQALIGHWRTNPDYRVSLEKIGRALGGPSAGQA